MESAILLETLWVLRREHISVGVGALGCLLAACEGPLAHFLAASQLVVAAWYRRGGPAYATRFANHAHGSHATASSIGCQSARRPALRLHVIYFDAFLSLLQTTVRWSFSLRSSSSCSCVGLLAFSGPCPIRQRLSGKRQLPSRVANNRPKSVHNSNQLRPYPRLIDGG
jgi:hypothetical protein